jgi:hypothetical protein
MRALRQYSFCVRPLDRQRSMWANILFRLRCRLVMIERLARSSDGYFRWTIWYCSGAYHTSDRNYRNDRTIYKLNSGLFSDTTAQRFVFYFFCRPAFFKNNFSLPHKWHIWFCPDTQSRSFAKPKELLFINPHTLYLSRLMRYIYQ